MVCHQDFPVLRVRQAKTSGYESMVGPLLKQAFLRWGTKKTSDEEEIMSDEQARRSSRSSDSSQVNPPSEELKLWKAYDDYQDIKRLQCGAEAVSSLTESFSSGRVFVVKRMINYPTYRPQPRHSSRQDFVPKSWPYPNEYNVLSTIKPHPNILKVFGCDLLGLRHANLYTEFCNGGDLSEFAVKRPGAGDLVPENFALHVFISLIRALAYLHYGLRWNAEYKRYCQETKYTPCVHGDVKPENVFLKWTQNPQQPGMPDIVLGDFGFTQPASRAEGVTGTTAYQAPELAAIRALKKVDPKAYERTMSTRGHMTFATDVFSLGQTMHVVCKAMLHQIGGDPHTKPVRRVMVGKRWQMIGVELDSSEVPSYVTPEIEDSIKRCLAPNPAMRPTMGLNGMLQMVEVFRKALEGFSVESEEVAKWPREV